MSKNLGNPFLSHKGGPSFLTKIDMPLLSTSKEGCKRYALSSIGPFLCKLKSTISPRGTWYLATSTFFSCSAQRRNSSGYKLGII
jgi:hypothetical protein